ncbi:MAG: hypothetical protein ACREXR_05620 [Gammaproteobacteria bacterium]
MIIPAIALVAVFVAWFFLPVKGWLDTFSGEGLGVWGGVVFAAAYIVATVVLDIRGQTRMALT